MRRAEVIGERPRPEDEQRTLRWLDISGARYPRDAAGSPRLRRAATIRAHGHRVVLVVVLVVVLIWRGPKTLPLLGRAFGQGVKEARKEIEGSRTARAEADGRDGRDQAQP